MSDHMISEHEIRVVEALRANGGWMTAKEVAVVGDVSDRTARHHCSRLADLNVVEVKKVFGGFRYRMLEGQTGSAADYIAALDDAKQSLM